MTKTSEHETSSWGRRLAGLALALACQAVLAMAPAPAALAQGLFRPVVTVNDGVVTGYELDQRIALLKALRTPGDLQTEAMERLISDRLQVQAARRAGTMPEEKDILVGIEEFAARANLSADAFIAALAEEGVAPETFRDFVVAGIAWRDLVRQRFGPRVTITEADIDRELGLMGTRGSLRVLFSEIFLPTNTPENERISLELAPQIANLRGLEDFAEAARRFSAGASRQNGGRVDNWVDVANLPPQLRDVLTGMRPGEITEPIEIPNALALFQLRAIEETTAPVDPDPVIDYASLALAGAGSAETAARAATLMAKADRCDDLYGLLPDAAPEALRRNVGPLATIPADIALELARLDPGEASARLTRDAGQTLLLVMLCNRTTTEAAAMSRDEVRQILQNRKLTAYADGLLRELRGQAVIVRK